VGVSVKETTLKQRRKSQKTIILKCGCGIHPLSLALPNYFPAFLASTQGQRIISRADGTLPFAPIKCKACGGAITLQRYNLRKYLVARKRLLKIFPEFEKISQTFLTMSLLGKMGQKAFSRMTASMLAPVIAQTTEPAPIKDTKRRRARQDVRD